MACETQQQNLQALQAMRARIQQQMQNPNLSAQARSQLLAQFKQIGPSITAAQNALNQCLAQNHPPPPPKLQPASILSITPILPDSVPNMIAKRNSLLLSITGKKFPSEVGREWIQTLAQNEDYDDQIVSCCGWMVHPRDVNGDFEFSHPFGYDWEFSLALDKPAGAAEGPYDFLLSPGNKVNPALFPPDQQSEQAADEQRAQALNLDFPLGLLGVEMDGSLVPQQFKDNSPEGARAAVFGRWIIDTAHDMHRAEIHPPLLAVSATVTSATTTRALFTSRAFLVSELYTTDQDSLYKDSGGNDGTFYSHLVNEIVKIDTLRSTLIEAHPKIKEKPMRGSHVMRVQVRPPALPPSPAPITTNVLEVSYRFTVRTGVRVQLTSPARDTIEVAITLDSSTYKPPPLPANYGYRYSVDQLKKENADVGSAYLDVEVLSGAIHLLVGDLVGAAAIEGFLERGIQGDLYDLHKGDVAILTNSGAVLNALATSIPPNAGITVDDNQIYPVTGWVEAKWVPATSVVTTAGLGTQTTPPVHTTPPPDNTAKPPSNKPTQPGKPPIKPF